MIHDAALPDTVQPPAATTVERHGIYYSAARWTPETLQWLAMSLATDGRRALLGLRDDDLLAAWSDTVEAFRLPQSPERRELDPALHRLCRLSTAGLNAALETVLGGVRGDSAAALLAQSGPRDDGPDEPMLTLVILASNLPALALQPLLPALLLRRPVALKSATAEPLFAPAFVRALVSRLPGLAPGIAALTWPGGEQRLEEPLLEAAARVLAYGEAATLEDLEARAPGKIFAYGPKTSFAVLGDDVRVDQVMPGLATDIALFDQRGCLSIQAIYTSGDATVLARRLARRLETVAERWPTGSLDPVAAAGVQQIRSEAMLRGLIQPNLPLATGTVVVEPQPEFRPSPGLRTVRIHPLADLSRLPELLSPWSGKLQGAALAGRAAWKLAPELYELGLSRIAAPGQLQAADASWHNGGVHPFEALTGQALVGSDRVKSSGSAPEDC